MMTKIANAFQGIGLVLRSGGAIGADTAFESGAGELKDIYLANDANIKALKLAREFHPRWDHCSHYAQRLHARNGQIVLGEQLDSSVEFIVCWTRGEREVGGTAQALRLARHFGIRVFNLSKITDHQDLRKLYQEIKYA